MDLHFAEAQLRSVREISIDNVPTTNPIYCYANCLSALPSVHFPGAVNSKFTSTLQFQSPSSGEAIPTYRIMDSDGVIIDESRAPKDVSDAETLKLYKDMLLSGSTWYLRQLREGAV
jgi:hypothetical protein